MNADAIPAELKELPQWVVWRREQRDGKETKVPYCAATGHLASTTDPATWTSFEHAVSVAKLGADGVGFVFTQDDPYVGVDLDACVDGGRALHPAAQWIVDELDSYSEVSPSGTGVHIVVRAELNGGRNRTSSTGWGGEFEVYSHSRYFTFTGDVVRASLPRDAENLHVVLGRVFPPAAASSPRARAAHLLSDDEVLARARDAANGDKFTRLWAGDAAGYSSESEADLALLSVLGFWTQDPDQLDRLFRRSGLMREKWERQDYRDATIAKALTGDTYRDRARTDSSQTEADSVRVHDEPYRLPFRTLREVIADVPEEPRWIVPGYLAPGVETLIFGPPKVGKSTFTFRLFAAMEKGGKVLGFDVRQISYLLLSEESAYTLLDKAFQFGLQGTGECVMYHEARGLTWPEIVQEAVRRCIEKEHELLVVDTFAKWAGMGGERENQSGSVLEALEPLAAAKEAGIAVALIHHERKSGGSHGEGIRGSNAFAAAMDILVGVARPGVDDPNARVLRAESRFRTTPSELGVTLADDEYEVIDVQSARPGADTRKRLLELLADAPATRAVLAELADVSQNTVIQHLTALEADGSVYHTGTGGRGDPFVYHVAERDS